MVCLYAEIDPEDLPAPKKAAIDSVLDMMHEIKDETASELKKESLKAFDEPHGMGATLRDVEKSRTEREKDLTLPVPRTSGQTSPFFVSEVPEARAVVVLHAHFKSGEVRRSHGFCIDNKQGILVGGAHTLPLKLQDLVLIEVHLYNSKENRFTECFVAELLPGGVSSTF